MNKTRINSARAFAHEGHNAIKQVRKYSGEPYTVHIDEVANIITKAGGSEDQIIVAYLHDLVEDVYPHLQEYSPSAILSSFGDGIQLGVLQLTHHFTSELFPGVSRTVRKKAEADRLALALPEWQTVKYADMLSNSNRIVKHDRKFAAVYLLELEYLLSVMDKGDHILYERVWVQLSEELSVLWREKGTPTV